MFVVPPLFRQTPTWYCKGLTQIASRFSAIFSNNSPPNLHLLPSFPSQDLLPDGRHLTPVAGLHYLLHVFDQTDTLLSRDGVGGDVQLAQVQEQVRHHEDRMSYLENRHVGLQKQVCHKVATDAEFDDWIQNRNEEDWFVIMGLPRLANVTRQEWPQAVRKQVVETIEMVLKANRARLNYEVLYVTNPFKLPDSSRTATYNVRMDSVFTSTRIREIFSGFFRRVNPVKRPSALNGVSFRNKITLETKIRIEILRQLGRKYESSNPGASFKVQGFGPRPKLVTNPPRSSTDRPRTYNFIQAATTLPASFNDEHLTRIFQVIGDRFRGMLQSLFICLSDDDHDRCLELVKSSSRAPRGNAQPHQFASAQGSGAQGSSSDMLQSSSTSGQVQGSGSGMNLQSNFSFGSMRDPPPPVHVPAQETELSRAHDERVRQRREAPQQPVEADRRGVRRRQSTSPESDPDSNRKHKKSKKSKHARRSRSPSSASSRSGSSRSPSSSPGRNNHKSKKSSGKSKGSKKNKK